MISPEHRFPLFGIMLPEADLIRHIVFFSAKRRENVEAMRTGLMALGTIPHSSLFEVSLNTKVDPLSDEIDMVVYAEFPRRGSAHRLQGASDLCGDDRQGATAARVALLRRRGRGSGYSFGPENRLTALPSLSTIQRWRSPSAAAGTRPPIRR